jgi:hypothetical protein
MILIFFKLLLTKLSIMYIYLDIYDDIPQPPPSSSPLLLLLLLLLLLFLLIWVFGLVYAHLD